MNKSSIKIIFFGTSDFAVPALEALVKAGPIRNKTDQLSAGQISNGVNYDVAAVITAPDKPVGRKQIFTPPPVKVAAQKLGLPVLQPEKLKNNSELVEQLKNLLNAKRSTLNASISIVAAYGKLIPPEIFNLPKHGILNIHPSLLPKYRGPSPIQTAILNGDTETGVTIMKVDEEMDHGPVIANCQLLIANEDNYLTLHNKLAKFGAELLIKTLPGYLAGKIKPQPQDHSKATYTKKFVTDNGEIKTNDTVQTAYNKIRALNPEPGTYFVIDQKNKKIKLKVLEAQPQDGQEVEPLRRGVFIKKSSPILILKNGNLLLKTVQPEGKKPMSGQDFARGYGKMLQLPHA